MSKPIYPHFYHLMGKLEDRIFGAHFEDGVLSFEDIMFPGDPDERPKYELDIEQVDIGVTGSYLVAIDGVVLTPNEDHLVEYIMKLCHLGG